MSFWLFFNIFVVAMLVLDLGVFHRHDRHIKIHESLLWTLFWIFLAFLFGLGIYFFLGPQKALEFTAGYLVEYSLSVDNLFVFLLIFSYFRVPHQYQYKVLFWGILGAIVSRLAFIVVGTALLRQFHWLIYGFGAFLVFTGIKMISHKGEEIHPEHNPVMRLLEKIIPVLHHYESGKFFIRKDMRLYATTLFVVLVFVDVMDIIFAVDSIPAIFSITLDPVIVYSSNVFAILGLRSLYFSLHGLMQLFHYLHYGLAVILAFVGVKMLLEGCCHIPIVFALGVIATILFVSIVASIVWPKKIEGGK